VEAQDGEDPRKAETRPTTAEKKPTKGSNETHDSGEETHKGQRRRIANQEQNHRSAKKKKISYQVDELRGEGGFCARSKMGVVRD
jgi:hypothetical protein